MNDGIEERLRKLEITTTQIKGDVKTIASKIETVNEAIKELAFVAKQQIKISAEFESLKKYNEKVDALFRKLDQIQEKLISLEFRITKLEEFKSSTSTKAWEVIKPILIAGIMFAIGFIIRGIK